MPSTLTMQLSTGASATFNNVQVDAYNCDPVYAEGTQIVTEQKRLVRGTAIVNTGTTNYTTFLNTLRDSAGRLNTASLTVNGQSLFAASTDARGWPTAKVETTEIVGTQTALMRFEIENHVTFNGNQTVTAHRWTQRMSMDAAGKPTRTVNGTLHVTRSTSGGSTTAPTGPASFTGRVAYADLFRNAIIPPVPGPGWRREGQEFALDELGTMLNYSFTDKWHTHDLPDGVKVGNMNCVYERSMQNATLATIQFSCELEGEQGLKNITGTTGNRKLVEAAVQLAKTRVDLNFQQTWITRMRVEERDMLSGYAIRFELDAMVQPKASDSAGAGSILGLAYMVGNEFTITRTEIREAPPYGSSMLVDGIESQYAMLPYFVNNLIDGMANTGGTMPQAALFTIPKANTYGPVDVAIISNAAGVNLMNTGLGGAFVENVTGQASVSGFTTAIPQMHGHTKTTVDPGIVRLSPMYVDQPDLLFQTRKPTAVVTEHIEVARMNQAPPRYQRPLPAQAYLANEDWRVSHGQYDAQGNRVFSGIYTRSYVTYDVGAGSTVGFSTFTAPSGAFVRRWSTPNSGILPPISPASPGVSDMAALSSLAAATDARQQYAVTTATLVT
jgi:hypothetical protein